MAEPQLIAAGTFVGTGTAAWSGPRVGFTSAVTDNGAGDWTLNLDANEPVPANLAGCLVSLTAIHNAAILYGFERVSSTSVRLRAAIHDGTATDVVTSIAIWRIPDDA